MLALPDGVRMTSCGVLGWVTDRGSGYRYQATHPVTNGPWPPIPQRLIELWSGLSTYPHPPQACLVNFCSAEARMDGLHQDRDEQDFAAPVLSVSLGDVIVLGCESRLTFHGVDRIYPSTSTLLKNGGRILTLRRMI